MSEALINMGVSSQGGYKSLRGQSLAFSSMFESFMDVVVSSQVLDTLLRS